MTHVASLFSRRVIQHTFDTSKRVEVVPKESTTLVLCCNFRQWWQINYQCIFTCFSTYQIFTLPFIALIDIYFYCTMMSKVCCLCTLYHISLNVDFSRLWMLQIFPWTGPVEITISSVLLNVVTCDWRLIIPFRYGPLKHPSSIPQHLKHLFDTGCDRESWKFDMLCCRSLMLRKQNVLPWIAVMYIHTKEVGSFTLEIKVRCQ